MDDVGFLRQVAQKIFSKEQNNMHNVMVLFPNRRAIRFFFEYLKREVGDETSFFVPEIFSIDEMVVKNICDIRKGDNLELLYLLYTAYCESMKAHFQSDNSITIETFDDFYPWGETVLSDFDQIDKELVDAKSLFRNLQDYEDLETDAAGYLTNEQISLINRLFNTTLAKDKSTMRQNFVKIWNSMYAIYERFNALLDEYHLAYSGKLYKEFSKRLENKDIFLSCEKIKVIGFSVLNKVEQKIFRFLKENYITDFYWDYDKYYTDDMLNEAGIFIRENLLRFPQSEDLKDMKFDNIATNSQEINVVSSPYETTSLSYITIWLNEILSSRNNETITSDKNLNLAIILNDESLVPLVMKTLPEEYRYQTNITMGYPFNQTFLYNEVLEKLNALIDSGNFNRENIFNTIKQIAQASSKDEKNSNLWQMSALKKICLEIDGFLSVLEKNEMLNSMGEKVMKNVLRRHLSSLNLDIISNGLGKVQLMGLLETRTLDFDYVLMLSANDDVLPHLTQETSFIPFSFRTAYKMMNTDRKAGVFAYYFYRLLHKAKRVDYVFTTVGGETKLKEKSRFIRQLEIEFKNLKGTTKTINYRNLTATKALRSTSREYYFDINDMNFIDTKDKTLSPSALNNLVHCQQKFYLNNIRYLREEIEDDNYLAIAFGNIFHNCASELYKIVKNDNVEDKQAKQIIESVVQDYITREGNVKEKRVCGDKVHLNMIKKYLFDVFKQDKKEKVEYLCGEKEYSWDLQLDNHIIHLKGRLDRMDLFETEKGNKVLRIVDYKTGNAKDRWFKSFEDLMFPPSATKSRKDGLENIFEILFYCYLVFNEEKVDKIKPELMYLTQIKEKDILIAKGKRGEKETFYYDASANEQFEQCLKTLLNTLLQKRQGEKYDATISEEKCKYCDYKLLCNI